MADQSAMAVHQGITTEEAECLVPADESMFIRQYVQYGIEHGDQPIIYFISSALALLSSVMPWGLCTADIEGGITPANFFTLIIGPTGAGHKTTALKRGSRLLYMAGLANRYASDIGSTQSLEDMLEAQGGQVFLCMAEVGDFLKATVEGPRERDRTWLCKVFDCEPIKSSTRSKGSVNVPNPRLTWQGAVNYEFIEVFTTRSDWDGGLMSRVFIANSACTREDPPYPDEAAQAERDQRELFAVQKPTPHQRELRERIEARLSFQKEPAASRSFGEPSGLPSALASAPSTIVGSADAPPLFVILCNGAAMNHATDLKSHLSPYVRAKIMRVWTLGDIPAGAVRSALIARQLGDAKVVVHLCEARYLNSSFVDCDGVPVTEFASFDHLVRLPPLRILEEALNLAPTARHVPVLLTTCDLCYSALSGKRPLPRNEKPVTLWGDRDSAWSDVAQGLRQIAVSLS